jgi:D-glycero-D-manno-heptose 1,7-bisphosphate phosphatase
METTTDAKPESSAAPQDTSRQLRPAVFLDRDGTICEEMGYLNHISRLRMFRQSGPAVRRLNRAGIAVIVVTNQSGVSRGIFPESLIAEVHRRVSKDLAAAGARVDAYYYCAHIGADKCDCRKPLPGLLLRAASEHGLDLERSFMVGDRYGDVELAHAAGGQGLLVLTGYGRGEYELHRDEWPRQPDGVVEDIAEAADFILKRLNGAAGKRGKSTARTGKSTNKPAKNRIAKPKGRGLRARKPKGGGKARV